MPLFLSFVPNDLRIKRQKIKKKTKKFDSLTVLQSDDLLVLLLGDSCQRVQVLQCQLQHHRFLQVAERLRGEKQQRATVSAKLQSRVCVFGMEKL